MISAQGQKNIQERLIQALMEPANAAWEQVIAAASADNSTLQNPETIKVIGNIMKTNVAACSSIGSYFYPQIFKIYMDMLSMYRATSQMISEAVQTQGKYIEPSNRAFTYSLQAKWQQKHQRFEV
jgi:exportin-1